MTRYERTMNSSSTPAPDQAAALRDLGRALSAALAPLCLAVLTRLWFLGPFALVVYLRLNRMRRDLENLFSALANAPQGVPAPAPTRKSPRRANPAPVSRRPESAHRSPRAARPAAPAPVVSTSPRARPAPYPRPARPVSRPLWRVRAAVFARPFLKRRWAEPSSLALIVTK